MTIKLCKKCLKEKPQERFAANPKCQGGRGHTCLACHNAHKKTLRRTFDLASLRSLLFYNAATGKFSWLSGQRRGKEAGSINDEGYRAIRVLSGVYKAHRLAWFYCHGEWPRFFIDHANGDKTDNRLENLRECSRRQNMANSRVRRDSRSGLKGVFASKCGKFWKARIWESGVLTDLGRFQTKEQAHAAYFLAAQRMFGEFARAE